MPDRPESWIPDDWTPTPANLNALPLPLRRYIMWLETNADPAGTLQELFCRRQQVEELEAALAAQDGNEKGPGG